MEARCNILFSGLDYSSIQAAANQFKSQATRPAHLTSMRYHPQNQGLNSHYGLAHASERDRGFRESNSNFEPPILRRQFSPQLVQHVPYQQHHFMHHTSQQHLQHPNQQNPHPSQHCLQQRHAHYQGCEVPSLNFRQLSAPIRQSSATSQKDSSHREQKKRAQKGLLPFVSPYQLIPFPGGLADDVHQQLKMTPRAPSTQLISSPRTPTTTSAVSQGAEHRAQKGGGAACIDRAADKPQRGGPQWQFDPNQQPQHQKLTAHTLSPVLESGRSPLFLSTDYRCASWSEAAGLHACELEPEGWEQAGSAHVEATPPFVCNAEKTLLKAVRSPPAVRRLNNLYRMSFNMVLCVSINRPLI